MFKKYIFYSICLFPNLFHKLWFLLPKDYRRDHLKRALLKIVHNGDTCVEVGANVGQYTPHLSYLAGTSGRVIAFEPIEENLKELRQRITKRQIFDTIKVEPVALGDRTGKTKIYLPENAGAMASLARHDNIHWQPFKHIKEMEIPLETLDNYTSAKAFSRLDIIKIDVEGAECLFFKGAMQSIKKFHPVIVIEILEIMNKIFNWTPQQTFELLKTEGYNYVYQLSHDGNGIKRIISIDQANMNSTLDDFIFSTKPIGF